MRLKPTHDSVWPDPESAEYREASWRLRNSTPRREDCMQAASVMDAYDHLLRHPAGTERVVRTLRTLRRMIRDRRRG